MIPNSHIEYYGDETRWFIGVVIDVKDPRGLGRVKVRIYGVHSDDINDVPNSDLPWAQVVVPVTEGGSSGIGANTGIKEQAQVFGVFLDGKNSQLPLVMGSIPKIGAISTQQRQQLNNQLSKDKLSVSGSGNDVKISTGRISAARSKKLDDNLPGNTNVEKAFNFLISDQGLNLTDAQAAGICGNLLHESGPGDIDPRKVSGVKGEGSTGIAQWNPAIGRLQELQKFSAERSYNWKSLTAQLLFLAYELKSKPYLGLSTLRQANTVEEATEAFMKKFERPAGDGGIKQRIAAARDVYKEQTA